MFFYFIVNFALIIEKQYIMTPTELNAQIWRDMGILAESEPMMKRVARYLRKLVAEKEADPTMVSREEFFASLDRGEEEYRQGKTHRINSLEELNQFIKNL